MSQQEDGRDVAQVLSDGRYDLPMFLRYLKTFAMSGTQPDKAILLGILMQSLARFHTSDFTACMCLVASYMQDSSSVEKEIAYIYELENFLTCGQFTKFWSQWSKVKEHLPESFHFETRVRTSILECISLTLESIPVARLAAYLAVPVDQLPRVIENAKKRDGEFEVVSVDADSVTFAQNLFNHPESSTNQDMLKFSDIVTIVDTV
ncbi:unnamed protein product [Phytomonas sp. EM1]|nr:unnamed protein product [Phytomonas sp. EM1]|eukprot:CCW60418.1 unnamed protein product [Phytomonas sp. isolate EM1]